MTSLTPLFHFIATATTFFLAFLSLSIGIIILLFSILYHIIKENKMLSIGACTRMIANFLGNTFPTPAPREGLPPFDASTATIPELRRLLATETVTSAFLVEIYLDQISQHPSTIFTFPKTELMARARGCDDMRAEGKIMRPLGGIPVLAAMEAAEYEQIVLELERAGGGVDLPLVAGSMLVMGFVKENVLGELVKWERLQDGTVVMETCVVEGLAVVVRNVEGGLRLDLDRMKMGAWVGLRNHLEG